MYAQLNLAWRGLTGAIGLCAYAPVVIYCIALSWLRRPKPTDPLTVWERLHPERDQVDAMVRAELRRRRFLLTKTNCP